MKTNTSSFWTLYLPQIDTNLHDYFTKLHITPVKLHSPKCPRSIPINTYIMWKYWNIYSNHQGWYGKSIGIFGSWKPHQNYRGCMLEKWQKKFREKCFRLWNDTELTKMPLDCLDWRAWTAGTVGLSWDFGSSHVLVL